MTKEKAIEFLTRRAVQIEDAMRLDEESGGIFCGIPTQGEIQIYKHFEELINLLQPVVTYDPNWRCSSGKHTEASFTIELNGKKYKIFTLLNQGGKR